jgi:hypothetical protein
MIIMNPIWTQLVNRESLRNRNKQSPGLNTQSNYKQAKSYREFIITIRRLVKDFFLITAGIFAAAFGLKGFLLTNHFIDGGVTGISLLVTQLTGIPLFVLIICINIPFIVLGYVILGKQFAIKNSARHFRPGTVFGNRQFSGCNQRQFAGGSIWWLLPGSWHWSHRTGRCCN